MGKNDHARLPSVNKNLFDKANCPAFIAVQHAINIASSQCKSHDAGATTQPMNEAYGSQHSRSTRGMMFQDRCRRVVQNKAHFHETLSSTTFRLQRGRNPLQGAPAMDDYISPSGKSGLADRASSQASKWAPRCSRCSAAASKHVICLH